MNVYFIEEDPKLFSEVEKMVKKYLERVNVCKTKPDRVEVDLLHPESDSLVLFDLDCASNGLELFDSLRRRTGAPIIAIDDVRGSPNRLIKALKLGASDYLLKPVLRSHLLSAVITNSNLRFKGSRG